VLVPARPLVMAGPYVRMPDRILERGSRKTAFLVSPGLISISECSPLRCQIHSGRPGIPSGIHRNDPRSRSGKHLDKKRNPAGEPWGPLLRAAPGPGGKPRSASRPGTKPSEYCPSRPAVAAVTSSPEGWIPRWASSLEKTNCISTYTPHFAGSVPGGCIRPVLQKPLEELLVPAGVLKHLRLQVLCEIFP